MVPCVISFGSMNILLLLLSLQAHAATKTTYLICHGFERAARAGEIVISVKMEDVGNKTLFVRWSNDAAYVVAPGAVCGSPIPTPCRTQLGEGATIHHACGLQTLVAEAKLSLSANASQGNFRCEFPGAGKSQTIELTNCRDGN